MALVGLVLNLKMPNHNWTDATDPVKQSLCVMLALFGGWGIIIALGVVYYFASALITPVLYLILVSAVLATSSALLLRWIDTKGAEIFESL